MGTLGGKGLMFKLFGQKTMHKKSISSRVKTTKIDAFGQKIFMCHNPNYQRYIISIMRTNHEREAI